MTYTEMLNKVLDGSGKMLKEIAEECQKSGVNLTNTYLSSLKTTPGKIASDDISRAIAKACEAKYEDILVVQAYLDRAPAVIIEFLEHTKKMSGFAADLMSMGELSVDYMQAIQTLQEYTLAEYVCETILESRDKENDERMKAVKEKYRQEKEEPKCMVIYPEQLKNVKFVSESELQKLTE